MTTFEQVRTCEMQENAIYDGRIGASTGTDGYNWYSSRVSFRYGQ